MAGGQPDNRVAILPVLLSFNAGYVDTAGFLALQGLFTAHVTGNFVTLGAAIVFGTTGVAAKLTALPVFCVMVVLSRLLGRLLAARDRKRRSDPAARSRRCSSRSERCSPFALDRFANGDAWPAIITGHDAGRRDGDPKRCAAGTSFECPADDADDRNHDPDHDRSRRSCHGSRRRHAEHPPSPHDRRRHRLCRWLRTGRRTL